VTINGRTYGPTEVRDELTMNDYLREYLGLTGTKFGCGAAQCLSCAVIVDDPDGTSHTSPTCIVSAVRFNGKSIRTVEGHAKDGELSVLQKAFIDHFAFQCGYCTAGFLNESQVLLERLARKRVARADLEKTIAEALDGHLCRCTGYIKYHEAVRDVILADPQHYLTLAEICAQIKDPARNGGRSLDEIVHHVGEDHLVGYAWAPGGNRQPAPGTQAQEGALLDAWVKTGAVCPN
jgi:aerobic-type carbon monoxide dehydrogenase small subunit (CoxS/CutS family)